MDLRPGDTIFGRSRDESYEILRLIGSGNFGVVYEVRDKEDKRFALKTIITAGLNQTRLNMLLNEGQAATMIRHENVLQVLYFHDGSQYPQLPPYMLMEHAGGGTLQKVLDEKKVREEHFSPDELRALFVQLASGMKAISERLIHRDLKPDNILILNDVLKISDFGLSKIVGVATRTRTFKGINHYKYCAPEALRLDKNLPAMDMYSMGVVFYELATLHDPYQVDVTVDPLEAWREAHLTQVPTEPRTYNQSLDTGLAQILLKMMSKRPEDRYASWDLVLQRLQSSESPESRKINVRSLVEHAIERHQQAEKERLRVESRERQWQELKNLVEYCFTEISDVARETVEAFNRDSDFIKLGIHQIEKSRLSIYAENGMGGVLPTVEFRVEPVIEPDTRLTDGREVKAWGFVKAPSGRGFNLLLVVSGPDDLYGHWLTLHVSYHPTFRKEEDDRPEPFPFRIHELLREITHENAAQAYQITKGLFNPEFLTPLIAELL
jgi:eukaryotic-like serine/threonine-protein kinase